MKYKKNRIFKRTKKNKIGKKNRFSNKKTKSILPLIKEYIVNLHIKNKNKNLTYIYAEDIANEFNCPIHIIKQCLHKLNLEGWLSKKYNHAPLDSPRSIFPLNNSMWCASFYIIKENKILSAIRNKSKL